MSAGGSEPSSLIGIDGIVRRLWVTSSPISPFPRVAPRSNSPFAVQQRDREAVDLRLDHVLELRVLDPLAGEVVAHPRDPCPQLLGAAGVCQRQHRLRMADLLELGYRLAAGPLRRRVGRDQLGMLGLDRPQLVEQLVVLVVPDLGIVEDVVTVAVVVELLAQLGRALGDVLNPRPRWPPARSAGPGRSAAAPTDPSRSVRSKWIGVTAILPWATAARSVPVSSRSKLASP